MKKLAKRELQLGCGGGAGGERGPAHSFGRRIFKMERTHVRCYGGGAGADLLRFTSPAVFSTPSSKFSPLRFEAKPA